MLTCHWIGVFRKTERGSISWVVQVERTTNHDVKAIEYVLKEKFKQHDELNKVSNLFVPSPASLLDDRAVSCT